MNSEDDYFLKRLTDTQSRKLLYALINHGWKKFEEQFHQTPPKATLQFIADMPFIVWADKYSQERQIFKLTGSSSGRQGHWGKDTQGKPLFIHTLNFYNVFQHSISLSPAKVTAADDNRCGLILLNTLQQEWAHHFPLSKQFIHNLERTRLQRHCELNFEHIAYERQAL